MKEANCIYCDEDGHGMDGNRILSFDCTTVTE